MDEEGAKELENIYNTFELKENEISVNRIPYMERCRNHAKKNKEKLSSYQAKKTVSKLSDENQVDTIGNGECKLKTQEEGAKELENIYNTFELKENEISVNRIPYMERCRNHAKKNKEKLTSYQAKKTVSKLSDENQVDAIENKVQKIKSQEEQRKSRNETAQKGLPSLAICASQIREKVKFINYGDHLYYFNGKCYDSIKHSELVTLYRDMVDKNLGGERSLGTIRQLYDFLLTESDIRVENVSHRDRVAILENGIYDVCKRKLRPHTSKLIAFSYIQANYVEDGDCKNFDRFLDDVTNKTPALINRLWMFLGYVLMQTTEAKVFFVMGEAPDSGKSLLGKFIESLFPKKSVSNIPLNDFNKKFSLAPLVGAAVNISLDLPAAKLNSSAVSALKMLTGGDTVLINEKFEPMFSYENRAKFIYATNSPIMLTERNDAFWRRLIYLPFDNTIPIHLQNRNLLDLFMKEKDAIVSKALRSAKTLIDNNFEFPSTPEIERKMRIWQGIDNPSINDFLNAYCIIAPDCRGELMDDLYKVYEEYCIETTYNPCPRAVFKQFLEHQVGLQHFKMRSNNSGNPRSAFRGIELLEELNG